MQAECSAQLTHTQMPLQHFDVLRKSESLLFLLAQRNSFTQTVNELKNEKINTFHDKAFHFAGGSSTARL